VKGSIFGRPCETYPISCAIIYILDRNAVAELLRDQIICRRCWNKFDRAGSGAGSNWGLHYPSLREVSHLMGVWTVLMNAALGRPNLKSFSCSLLSFQTTSYLGNSVNHLTYKNNSYNFHIQSFLTDYYYIMSK